MKKETVIGLIYRFDKNDYQISLTDFSESDQQTLQEIFMKYEDSWSCIRGDKNASIDDANIDYWERNQLMKTISTLNFDLNQADYNDLNKAIEVLYHYESAFRDNGLAEQHDYLHEARCTLIKIREKQPFEIERKL